PRASDLLARQGGDEFLLLLGDLDRDRDPEEVAVKASARILEALAQPFHVAGAEFQLGASIGVALYPRDAHDAEGLLKAADGAMYRAKRAGRGNYAFPEPDGGDARARLSMSTRLRRALARDELELHFQPVFKVETGELVAAEALLRYLHEAGFTLAIDDFGAGHSSLARLRDLPVDMLKVDRSFLAATPDDPQASAIVGAVLALANGLGMTTVAEGVETEAQHRFLREAGCPLAQGFHLGRPVPFAVM